MIKRISASDPRFRPVEFTSGFNVVLADKTTESTKGDSRNGVGKSTLVEIIHFLLGADADAKAHLWQHVTAWTFTMELSLGGQPATVSRTVGKPAQDRVVVSGPATSALSGSKLSLFAAETTVDVERWKRLLGMLMFGLPETPQPGLPAPPSFRALVSYFVRRGEDSVLSPFDASKHTKVGERQRVVSYLLGLGWEQAARLDAVKEQAKSVKHVRAAIKTGLLQGMSKKRPQLEALKVQLQQQLDLEEARLRSFRVHEQYREIQREAGVLTARLHELTNDRFSKSKLLELYEQQPKGEIAPEDSELEAVYTEAGVALPGSVKKQLADVRQFHRAVVANRSDYLAGEVKSLKAAIANLGTEIDAADGKRAALMAILQSHGALDEYTLLHQRVHAVRAKVAEVVAMIGNIKHIDEVASNQKVELAAAQQLGRRDFAEREAVLDRAIGHFNNNSSRLYDQPGELLVSFADTGFTFGVDMKRTGSGGIEKMKVFCFDLMLAQLWAGRPHSPGILIHDSRLFHGVDKRQMARALQLAAEESAKLGFQYICSLNSDDVPVAEFEDFGLDGYVRMKLTDVPASGSLLGMRF